MINRRLRIRVMLLLACLLLVGYAFAQVQVSSPVKSKKIISQIISLKSGAKPVVIVDGVIYKGELDSIDESNVQQIEVMKGKDAVTVFGKDAKDGAVLITTKQPAPNLDARLEKVSDYSIMLNGVVIDTISLKKIDTNSVAWITALKNEGPNDHFTHVRSKGLLIYTKDYVREVIRAKISRLNSAYKQYLKDSPQGKINYVLNGIELKQGELSQQVFEMPDHLFKNITFHLPISKNPATVKITTIP